MDYSFYKSQYLSGSLLFTKDNQFKDITDQWIIDKIDEHEPGFKNNYKKIPLVNYNDIDKEDQSNGGIIAFEDKRINNSITYWTFWYNFRKTIDCDDYFDKYKIW